jgi:hypothetical protein
MRCIPVSLKLLASIALGLGVAGACSKHDAAGTGGAASTDKAAAPAGAAPAATGTAYSCTKQGDWCMDYAGEALVIGEAALQGTCSAMSGAFATGACSKDKALGSCNLGKGVVKTYYPSESNTPDAARSDCDLHDAKYTAAP